MPTSRIDAYIGASSFTAEGASRGHNTRACDLLYGLPHARLMDKACADTAYALGIKVIRETGPAVGLRGEPLVRRKESGLEALSDQVVMKSNHKRDTAGCRGCTHCFCAENERVMQMDDVEASECCKQARDQGHIPNM